MRFSHPIVAACRAKPAMENQSRATVFGAVGGNHFLVASWAVEAASGIGVTSHRHSLASSKLVSASARSKRLCLDLSHAPLQAGARKCLSANGSPRVKAIDCSYMGSRTRNSQPFYQISKLQSSNFQGGPRAMSALGQKRTSALQKVMSALPSIATAKADVSYGPEEGIATFSSLASAWR